VSTGTALQAALKSQQKATSPPAIVVTGTITPENSTEADGTPPSKIDVKDLKNVSVLKLVEQVPTIVVANAGLGKLRP
jgi:pectate lyase